jgi:hypothetical protein
MSLATLEPPEMTDKSKKQPLTTLPVRLHADVVETARIVSAYTGESMTDMLSDILRPVLRRRETEEVAKRNRPPKGGVK